MGDGLVSYLGLSVEGTHLPYAGVDCVINQGLLRECEGVLVL